MNLGDFTFGTFVRDITVGILAGLLTSYITKRSDRIVFAFNSFLARTKASVQSTWKRCFTPKRIPVLALVKLKIIHAAGIVLPGVVTLAQVCFWVIFITFNLSRIGGRDVTARVDPTPSEATYVGTNRHIRSMSPHGWQHQQYSGSESVCPEWWSCNLIRYTEEDSITPQYSSGLPRITDCSPVRKGRKKSRTVKRCTVEFRPPILSLALAEEPAI
jgi:hypothetical protein